MLAATAGAGLILAGLLAYNIGWRALSPADRVAERPAAGSSGAGDLLRLSVFDEPRPMPEIRFADERGHEVSLADFRGRVVLLNLWATWCVPCRAEMPSLDRLQALLGGEGFQVVALSIDRQGVEPVKRFYRELGLEKLAIYVDPPGKSSRALAAPGVPMTVLLDRNGREVARKMGAAEWDSPEIVLLIERVIRDRSAGERDRGG
jgi:thiol-disulfide isomerase/thioredoxin